MNTEFMVRTITFELHVNRVQRRSLDRLLGLQRAVYNAALQERRDSWRWACSLASHLGLSRFDRRAVEAIDPDTLDADRQEIRAKLLAHESPNWYRQKTSLTLKAQAERLGEVVLDAPSTATRWTLMRVEKAMQAFFDRAKSGKTPGFPRFRARSRWSTIGFDELADGAFKRPEIVASSRRSAGELKVPGIPGTLVVRMERVMPEGSEVRAATLTRNGTRCRVALQCRVPRPSTLFGEAELAEVGDHQVIGIDWGVVDLATSDDGLAVANIRLNARLAGSVRRAHRMVARSRRESRGRRKKVRRLARLKRHEANTRHDSLRKGAAAVVGYARRRGAVAIAMEDLKVMNMTRSARGTAEDPGRNVRQKAGLNRGILDAAPATFAQFVRDKAESAGLWTTMVRPNGTSTQCSACGADVPKTLRVREHRCPHCGLVLGRDENAARNIARRGAEQLRVKGRAAQGHDHAPPATVAGVGMRPRRGRIVTKPAVAPARAGLG